MSDSHKYLIFGHSDKTDEKFDLPRNVKLLFAANEGEICTVLGTYKSIIAEIATINSETPRQEENINYTISFNPNTSDGIYKLNFNKDPISLEKKYDTTDTDTLENYISFIRKGICIGEIGPSDTITIYCIFCRGGNPEEFQTKKVHNTYTEPDSFWDLNQEDTGTDFLDTGTDFLGGTVKCIKKNKKVKSRKNKKNKKTKKQKHPKTRTPKKIYNKSRI